MQWWEQPVKAIDFSVEEGQYKQTFHLGWEREAEILKRGLYLHEASVSEELSMS